MCFDWLKSVHHSLHFLKSEYGAMERFRSLVFFQTWIAICLKVIMEFFQMTPKINCLPWLLCMMYLKNAITGKIIKQDLESKIKKVVAKSSFQHVCGLPTWMLLIGLPFKWLSGLLIFTQGSSCLTCLCLMVSYTTIWEGFIRNHLKKGQALWKNTYQVTE